MRWVEYHHEKVPFSMDVWPIDGYHAIPSIFSSWSWHLGLGPNHQLFVQISTPQELLFYELQNQ